MTSEIISRNEGGKKLKEEAYKMAAFWYNNYIPEEVNKMAVFR